MPKFTARRMITPSAEKRADNPEECFKSLTGSNEGAYNCIFRLAQENRLAQEKVRARKQ
jgi:hypothetical protein